MDLHVISHGATSAQAQDLADYHRLRHDVFVALAGLGRQDLYAAAGLETDIWDLTFMEPVHFLVRDAGEPVAVGRMTSTKFPTMMETLYPHFVDGACPKDDALWEIQRLGVKLDLSKREKERALLTLLAGMMRWSFDHGVKRVMLLTFEGIAKKRLHLMQRMGPTHLHLGFPHIAMIGDILEARVAEYDAMRCALEAEERKVA